VYPDTIDGLVALAKAPSKLIIVMPLLALLPLALLRLTKTRRVRRTAV
jgi:hydrogenase-4 component B